MLLTLIKNEIIKIFNKKKTWAVFILFFVGLITINIFMYKDSKNLEKSQKPENIIIEMNSQIETAKTRIKEIEKEKRETEDKERLATLDGNIEQGKADIEMFENTVKEQEAIINSPKKTWQEEVQDIIIKNKENIIKSENIINLREREGDIKIYNREIEMNQYYLDNNIKPVDIFGFSVGENVGGIFNLLGAGILAIGIAVFMGDIVSGECTPTTFKFLLVQPVSRSKILLSKIIAINITVLILILGSELITTVIGVGLFDGFDSLNSLKLVGQKYELVMQYGHPIMNNITGSGHLISYAEFIWKSFAYQGLFIITVVSFVFMISTLFKSNIFSMSVSVIVVALGAILPYVDFIKGGLQYLFLSYGNPTDIIEGYLSYQMFCPDLNLGLIIKVMVATIAICYTISFLSFRKRDILI